AWLRLHDDCPCDDDEGELGLGDYEARSTDPAYPFAAYVTASSTSVSIGFPAWSAPPAAPTARFDVIEKLATDPGAAQQLVGVVPFDASFVPPLPHPNHVSQLRE